MSRMRDEQTREDRVTQPMDAGWLSWSLRSLGRSLCTRCLGGLALLGCFDGSVFFSSFGSVWLVGLLIVRA